jgi:hypothetical protein
MVSGKAGDLHGVTWDYYRKLAEQPEPTGRAARARSCARAMAPRACTARAQPSTTATTRSMCRKRWGSCKTGRPASRGACTPALSARTTPISSRSEYLDRYNLEDIPLPPSYADDLQDKPRVYQRMRQQVFGQLSEREVREAIRHFLGLLLVPGRSVWADPGCPGANRAGREYPGAVLLRPRRLLRRARPVCQGHPLL